MTLVQYDGTFEGLFTAVFEIYEYRIEHPHIVKDEASAGSLFGVAHRVATDRVKSSRILNRVTTLVCSKTVRQLYHAWLSSIKGIDDALFRYVQYALSSNFVIENNYADPSVLLIQQTSKKVQREKHRMEAFVRFQLTKDELYYSVVQPDYNVLPLIAAHFKARFADQRWLIYDALRKYGLYYNKETVEEVELSFNTPTSNADFLEAINDENEALYQQLWKQYFGAVNIAARKNMKLHIQHMPRRYWRYLVEKRPGV